MTSTEILFSSAKWNEYLERNGLGPVWHHGLLEPVAESTAEHAYRTSIQPTLGRRKREEDLYLELYREVSSVDVPSGHNDYDLLREAMNRIITRRNRVSLFRNHCDSTYREPQKRSVNLPGGDCPLQVVTTLTRTKFYLDRRPGDPIFSYSHQQKPKDIRDCFEYQGNVPYPMTYDQIHLRVSAIKVFNILSVFLWFHANGPEPLGIPACQAIATVDSFKEDDMARLHHNWQIAERFHHFPGNYKTLLRTRSEFQEFVALLFRLHESGCDEDRQLIRSTEPLMKILGSFERPHGSTKGSAASAFPRLAPVLLRYMERHFENEANRARARLFDKHAYDRVLVYDVSCFAKNPASGGREYSIFDHYRQCNGLYVNGEAIFGWNVPIVNPTLDSFARHTSGTFAARNRVFRLVHSRTLEEQPLASLSSPAPFPSAHVAAFGDTDSDDDHCCRAFRDAAAAILRNRLAHTAAPSCLQQPTAAPNYVEEATGQPLRPLFLSTDPFLDLSLASSTFSSPLH